MKTNNWLKIGVLVVSFVLVVVMVFTAKQFENKRKVNHPNILVHVDGEDALLNEQELQQRLLERKVYRVNMPFYQLNLLQVENKIKGMEEVKDARVFKNIGGQWFIEVWLRRPIARIFKKDGTSCYLDSEGAVISVSSLHTARVLVFNGEIDEPLKGIKMDEIINNDSLKNIRKIDDCYRISNYVCNDPMLKPLIGQAYLDQYGDFVLIPLVGEQKIIFGFASSNQQVENKFRRLKIFYEEGMPFEGWQKYSEINLKYDGQIVGRKRHIEQQ